MRTNLLTADGAPMILAAILFVAIAPAHAATPWPKTGVCPSGYRDSGGFCAPMSRDAPAAIPKVGQCPSGYYQSGNYCREMR